MKKLVLTTVCALAMTGAALAQGYINYSLSFTSITAATNLASSPIVGGVNSAVGSGVTAVQFSGLGYMYALLYQPAGTVGVLNSSVWDGTWASAAYNGIPFTGTNGTTAGRLATTGGSGNLQVPWASGTTDNIIVVGWSSTLGTSWASVSGILSALAAGNSDPLVAQLNGQLGFFGESALGYISPNLSTPGAAIMGGGTTTANGLPIYSLNMQLYQVVPVPEPTALALMGLGGLSLLFIRRRK